MKYFIDTEFHEYHKQVTCCGIKIGKPIPTIALISIGIVAEDGRTYYAISKDFNVKDAWNSFQIEQVSGDQRNRFPEGIKKYWLRDNVLKSIFYELVGKDINFHDYDNWFTCSYFKKLIFKYGKSNKQITKEIIEFCKPIKNKFVGNALGLAFANDTQISTTNDLAEGQLLNRDNPEFYGYYSDYDWVVFCQLFGKMINLPNGFPMYCIDLKQRLDEMQDIENECYAHELLANGITLNPPKIIKKLSDYPKQDNEHNALDDAKWNLKLYQFLEKI